MTAAVDGFVTGQGICMKTYRGNAIAAGVLFILCSAASILSILPLGARVEAPVDLPGLERHADAVVVTALLEFVWTAGGAGVVIALYPVLRLFSPALALGAVASRLAENVVILISTLSLLTLLTLSRQAPPGATPSSLQVTGDALAAVRGWAPDVVAGLAFVVGTCLYDVVLYRSRLVPRWLSGLGLVGAALSLVVVLSIGFTQDFGFSMVNNVLSVPIGLQEMALAVWLIVKGFDRSALRSVLPAGGSADPGHAVAVQVTGP